MAQIEKKIVLNAPRSSVWRAISTPSAFGAWFGVELEGEFVEGEPISGRMTRPGYENLTWEVVVERIVPERLFSFRWHPSAVEPNQEYSEEQTTLVEFRLDEVEGGTRLTMAGSGSEEHFPVAPRGAVPEEEGGEKAAGEVADTGETAGTGEEDRPSPPAQTGGIADPEAAARLFGALGDETRLRLLGRLAASGPASIRELSAAEAVSRQTITKHLNVLVDVGLVRSYRSGRERLSELDPGRLDEAERYLRGIAAGWTKPGAGSSGG